MIKARPTTPCTAPPAAASPSRIGDYVKAGLVLLHIEQIAISLVAFVSA